VQVQLINNDEATSLLASGSFQKEWSALYDECPWATVMQSQPFADAWYSTYRPRFQPVLVIARDAAGRLVGLLALGSSKSGQLVVVGAHQAEYHAWIATVASADAFASAALAEVSRRYPKSSLTFRYLPPGTPLGWLEDKKLARRLVVSTHKRPLMRLSDDRFIQECSRRKTLRKRINKLRSMGFGEIEELKSVEALDAIFDEFIACHDLRRLAVSGSAPFENDPLKKPFHLELQRRGLLCTTVLRAGDRVVSTQLDFWGRGEVNLALGAYAPSLSRMSLGKLHTLEIARMLQRGGWETMDLTPGSDAYKEEFANAWDEVHKLTLVPRRSRARKVLHRCAEQVARHAIRRFEVDVNYAKAEAVEARRRPLASLARAVKGAADWLQSSTTTRLFSLPSAQIHSAYVDPGQNGISRDCLKELNIYRPLRSSDAPRHAVLAEASRSLSLASHAYTKSANGRLQFLAWMTDEPVTVLGEAITQSPRFPASAAFISNVQMFDPGFASQYATALRHIMRDAACNSEADTIIVAVPDRDQRLLRAVTDLRCVCIGKIETTVRLGRVRTTFNLVQPAAPAPARQPDLVNSAVSAVVSISPCLLAV
jgi:CelD/BcsL family acetyltransferase involved in cellulose biosynthesis